MPAVMLVTAAALAAESAPAQPVTPPPTAPQPPPAIPQQNVMQEPIGQVNGTVFDQSRKGVVGLPVAVIPQSGGVINATSTENGGRYAFKGLAAGTYTVAVSVPARGVLRKDAIRIRPLFRSIVDFTLTPDPSSGTLPQVTAGPGGGVDGAGTSDALTVTAALVGQDRLPVPDALLTMTPVDGAGRFGRCRTGPDGVCAPADLVEGTYRISVEAPGFITWSIGPLSIKGAGPVRLLVTLVPFPMGFEGTLEDLVIPVDPAAPRRSQR